MVALATEDKQVCVWRTGAGSGTAAGTTGASADPGDASKATMEAAPAEAAAAAASGHVLGKRELPKKPTSILFAPVVAPRADGAAATREKTEEVVVVSDKCGDAYAAPLPDPSSALKHLLGHTAMTITAMVTLKGGQLLATADRAEHIRVSQVCPPQQSLLNRCPATLAVPCTPPPPPRSTFVGTCPPLAVPCTPAFVRTADGKDQSKPSPCTAVALLLLIHPRLPPFLVTSSSFLALRSCTPISSDTKTSCPRWRRCPERWAQCCCREAGTAGWAFGTPRLVESETKRVSV